MTAKVPMHYKLVQGQRLWKNLGEQSKEKLENDFK